MDDSSNFLDKKDSYSSLTLPPELSSLESVFGFL
jgi:hypothetical protein